MEWITVASMTTTDDIFARPPRALARQMALAKPPLNACVVCGLRADVLLCRECAEQPEVSKARVLAWLNGNMDQANALLDTWDHIREPQQAAWEAIQDARLQPDFAARCARHRAAGNVYGKLLDAHAAYELALEPLNVERKRLEKALIFLNEWNI
jgi:hypothetical protein